MESEMIQALQTIADNIQAASQPGVIEYLSICISLVSVVVSGVAIRTAARVPKEIAEKQNNIVLFEKRYEVLCLYKMCKVFANMLKGREQSEDQTDIKRLFLFAFCDANIANESNFTYLNLIRIENEKIHEKMIQSRYLFEEEISLYVELAATLVYAIINDALIMEGGIEVENDRRYVRTLIALMCSNQCDAICKKMSEKLTL